MATPSPDPRMDIYARPQRLVKLNRRRRLNVHITGEGSPTVILSAGGGSTTLSWGLVQPQLSRNNHVLSFDRAGMGFSDPGPLPRTTSRAVADLRAALEATGTEPPYVLVGHSMGAFDVQLFAFQHPEEVIGMVLVDPRGHRIIERLGAVSRAFAALGPQEARRFRGNARIALRGPQAGGSEYESLAAPPSPMLTDAVNRAQREASLRPSFWRTISSEGDALNGVAMDELVAARRPLDMPLIVLTAARSPFDVLCPDDAAALSGVWKASHEELARLSSRGKRRDVPGVGHAIQFERPDVVADAIREVIGMSDG
ncbi:MAG: alpha/beta fold hydrolase [Caulobacteraceae bacterium]